MNGGAGPGRLDLMDAALAGLSVGDAFGDQFFLAANRGLSPDDEPPGPWEWSDDTELACSVADVLRRLGRIDQDELAAMFAARFDPSRRYGAGALELLEQVRAGVPWRQASAAQFGGRGSHGNGGAMRVAPLGAYYFGNPARAAAEAAAQAEVTHANIEGIAGAVAVAVAAATPQTGRALFDAVLDLTPGTYVRKGLRRARTLSGSTIEQAAAVPGNGSRISAQDTVPFALWAAARYHRDYPAAIRACVRAGDDMDTTAAITGGIVATQTGPEGIPSTWLLTREPLPAWIG